MLVDAYTFNEQRLQTMDGTILVSKHVTVGLHGADFLWTSYAPGTSYQKLRGIIHQQGPTHLRLWDILGRIQVIEDADLDDFVMTATRIGGSVVPMDGLGHGLE